MSNEIKESQIEALINLVKNVLGNERTDIDQSKIKMFTGLIKALFNSKPSIIDLETAALTLKLKPRVLQRKANTGHIPGAKPGKQWVFVDLDLIDWVRRQYKGVGSIDKEKVCLSIRNPTTLSGTHHSSDQMEAAYASLLKQPIAKLQKNGRRRNNMNYGNKKD